MDFEKLMYDSSMFLANQTAKKLTENPEFLENAINVAFKNINQISARTTNVIEIFDYQAPNEIKPFLRKIILKLPEFKFDGQVRSFLKLLIRHIHDLDDEEQGRLYEHCLKFVLNPKQPVAVRYYSIEILGIFAIKYPELENEVVSTIEIGLTEGTPAFKAMATEIFKSFKKTTKSRKNGT
jgi:hypothetical protein